MSISFFYFFLLFSYFELYISLTKAHHSRYQSVFNFAYKSHFEILEQYNCGYFLLIYGLSTASYLFLIFLSGRNCFSLTPNKKKPEYNDGYLKLLVIQQHDVAAPLFLMVSHNAVHSSNDASLLQAPPEDVRKMRHVEMTSRRLFAGMQFFKWNCAFYLNLFLNHSENFYV